MRFPAAIVVAIALALPAYAQHGGGHGGATSGHSGGSARGGAISHGGSTGRGGFSTHVRPPSYSGMVGIQQPSSFSPPGRFPLPGRLEPPSRSGAGLPDRGHDFSGGRYPNRPSYPGRHRHRDRYGDHDRDRRHGGRWAGGGFGYGYPYAYAYPYVVDPGFYDWGPSDYSENEQGADANGPSDQPPAYPAEPPYAGSGDVPDGQQQGYAQPSASIAPAQRQEYHFAPSPPAGERSTAFSTRESLTVIFKSGRPPVRIENYMLSSASLTNLDGGHFEKIPLDQIDVAATEQANRSRGIDFQVPIPSHD
jgi:hypothetical protein